MKLNKAKLKKLAIIADKLELYLLDFKDTSSYFYIADRCFLADMVSALYNRDTKDLDNEQQIKEVLRAKSIKYGNYSFNF